MNIIKTNIFLGNNFFTIAYNRLYLTNMTVKAFYNFSLLLCSFLLLSCSKETYSTLNSGSNAENSTSFNSISLPYPSNGKLSINGDSLKLSCNTSIKIAAGTYSSIAIKNINAGCIINIVNDGQVTLSGNGDQMYINNVSNVNIAGNATAGIATGFTFRDNPNYHSVNLDGTFHNLTLQYFAFQNNGNYAIFNTGQTVYDGSPKSYSDTVRILNMTSINSQALVQLGGNCTKDGITGFVKNLEIANVNFSNSECGTVVYVGEAENYNIHNNTISNINQVNNNHNGIFQIRGNGSFHHNLVKNHQGNAIRAWINSVGNAPREVTIYSNIVVNSRKYSAFEVQSFDWEMIPGITTYGNAKVYNNTCGNLDLSKDWVGVIVDIYNLYGGTCNVYNNIGFNFPAPGPDNFFVNQQSATLTNLSGNVYYPTAAAAGIPDVDKLVVSN